MKYNLLYFVFPRFFMVVILKKNHELKIFLNRLKNLKRDDEYPWQDEDGGGGGYLAQFEPKLDETLHSTAANVTQVL